ncbi:hypothetical protein B0H66DRAFT_606076 [Apodospora peruviana]|uniref:Myb-like domain-containing protein n=1 Tax=Apodospora peruviana TaxID=516989 RepID=A0AAE0HYA0_9PEZI|nr:hypothetical protein B0H66DRAFT_606076 [Apodospora peruviana]
MSSTTKSWSDRADKDLFFTILNVKNIGVISGSEWTTIGNHMRTLGYGFTNEGCRQHFQGLRRAQAKSDGGSSNGTSIPGASSSSDGPRKSDPTLNPITRRPGPGRGRPRKTPSKGAGASPGAAGASPVPGGPGGPGDPNVSGVPGVPGGPDVSGLQIGQGESQPSVDRQLSAEDQTPVADEELAVDPSLSNDEQAAKRPRLDEPQSASLEDEDEAVLSALTAHNAHNNATSVDHYAPEFHYGDA